MADEKASNPKKKSDLNLKDYITIGLSSVALVIAGETAYLNVVRVTDDVRVVVGNPLLLLRDSKTQQFVIEPKQRLIFINSGTRGVAISVIFLRVAQPMDGSDVPEDRCDSNGSSVIAYDAEPFVVRAGEMVTKETKLSAPPSPYAPPSGAQYTIREDGKIAIAVSEANQAREKYKYKVCLEIAFTTPDIEYNTVVLDEFEDELSVDVMGYLFTRESIEKRPLVLVKKTRTIFSPD